MWFQKSEAAERLQKAVESKSLQEIRSVWTAESDWTAEFVEGGATSALSEALTDGSDEVLELLLELTPKWAWTTRGLEAKGSQHADGALGYAVHENVSSVQFQHLVEALGKEAFVFQRMTWSYASSKRLVDVMAVWGDVARGPDFDPEARQWAMDQFEAFFELNGSMRGRWQNNKYAVRELQKGGGDAVYDEHFARIRGWDLVVCSAAAGDIDEPLQELFTILRDEEFSQLSQVGLFSLFSHMAPAVEPWIEKLSPDVWTQRDEDGVSLLFGIVGRRTHPTAIERMASVLGKEKMIDLLKETEAGRTPLHIAAEQRPWNMEVLKRKLHPVRFFLGLSPALGAIQDRNGNTALHLAVQNLTRGAFGCSERPDETALEFCAQVIRMYPREHMGILNNRGKTAFDIAGEDEDYKTLLDEFSPSVKNASS